MGTPVIVGAVRTAIGRSFKGTLVNTPPETLITAVLPEVVRRSGVDPSAIDDIIFAESHYGGGDLARYAATATGLIVLRSSGNPDGIGVVLTAFLSYWAGLDLAFGAWPLVRGHPYSFTGPIDPPAGTTPEEDEDNELADPPPWMGL